MKDQSRREAMFSIVESYHDRDCTQEEFCKRNDIKVSTLGYWITQQRRSQENTVNTFVPVKLSDSSSVNNMVILNLPSGIRVSISVSDLSSELASFVKALV